MKVVRKLMQFYIKTFFKILFAITGKPRLDKKLKKAIDLYKGEGFREVFAEVRAWDAPYEALEKVVPKSGKIIDLGSGDGLFVNYLALMSKARTLYGIELNKKRVRHANKGIKNTFFKEGNILKTSLTKARAFALIHVLHHLPSKDDQILMIKKIHTKLEKKGKLIILEIDTKPYLKYIFTWITDAVIVPVLFEGKLVNFNFYYRGRAEWQKILNKNGFKVKMKSVHKGMPFSHLLIEATKP